MDETKGNNRKAVYTIVEREGAKARWIRVGIAFVNRDGSYNVILDALPTNGQLHIRDFAPADAGESHADAAPEIEKPARRAPRAARA